MKTAIKIGASVILMITALWLVPLKVSAQNGNMNLQVFYDELGNYGTWVDNPDYGYVWVPNVDQDFKPYATNGHWVFTDYGWTWSSDYPWGWAAFHYGRWYWDQEYGNVWVPGTEWGPAWVVWKKSTEYYGWAPMSPGMNTSYSQSYNIPTESWCFVRNRDLSQNELYHYFVDPMRYNSLIRLTSLIVSAHYDSRYRYSYIFGPSQFEFQRYYGRSIHPIRINDYNRPGHSMNGDRYSIYRPQFSRRGSASYVQSRPLSYLKNRERVTVSSNKYYRNPRETERGRTEGLYNNGRRIPDRRSNDNGPGRSGNYDNYNRGSNENGSGRSNEQNNGSYNNNNRGSNTNVPNNNANRGSNENRYGNSNTSNTGTSNRGSNVSGSGNSNTTGTGNSNATNTGSSTRGTGTAGTVNTGSANTGTSTRGSGSAGSGNSTSPNTGASKGSGANGQGSSTSPNTSTPANNSNAGKTNARETPQTNKPATPQTNPDKGKTGNTSGQQKPADNQNQQAPQKDNSSPTSTEKRNLRNKIEPVSLAK